MTQPAPPSSQRHAYRLLGARLPAEYHPWVAEDVGGKSFLNWRILRTVLWGAVLLGLFLVGVSAVHTAPRWLTIVRLFAGVIIYSLLLTRRTLVRRALHWQRIDRYGRPAPLKGLGVLESREAVVAAASVLILVTGLGAVWGWGQRPTGYAGAPCRKPDAALTARLKAGFKDQNVEFILPQFVKFKDGGIVVMYYKVPHGVSTGAFDAFVVDKETIYEVHSPARAKESPTTFPAPVSTNQVSVDGLTRGLECLRNATTHSH